MRFLNLGILNFFEKFLILEIFYPGDGDFFMGWIISFGLESLILIIEAGHNLRMLKNLVVTSRRAVSVTRPSSIFSNVCMRR